MSIAALVVVLSAAAVVLAAPRAASAATDLTMTTTGNPPGAIAGQPYSYQFEGAGGTPPYTFRLSSVTGVPGLTLNPDGALTGTPIQQSDRPVQSVLGVQLWDAAGHFAGENVILTVTPPGYVPPPTLRISTTSLPSATLGAPYSQTLQASGGTPPYTWALVSGELPQGFSFKNGTLSGKSSEVQQTTFTVEVTDTGYQQPISQWQYVDETQRARQTYTFTVSSGYASADPTLISLFRSVNGSLAEVTVLEAEVTALLGRVPPPQCVVGLVEQLVNQSPPPGDCIGYL